MKLFLSGEITEESFARLAPQITSSSTATDLFVCSPGGDLELTFGLHDLMVNSARRIRTIATGRVQSAAPLLVACGSHRVSLRHTVWMLHSVSLEDADGTLAHVDANLVWGKKVTEVYARLLARYSSKRDHRFWLRRMGGTDVYFSAQEALEWGLVDEVWDGPDPA